METVNRHMDYIGHYERQIEREQVKKNPRDSFIQSCKAYIEHSRTRIQILNKG